MSNGLNYEGDNLKTSNKKNQGPPHKIRLYRTIHRLPISSTKPKRPYTCIHIGNNAITIFF